MRAHTMKKIGLVGGISWVSTLDYYRHINEGINAQLGGLNFAECLIYSLNFEDFQRHNRNGDWDKTRVLLLEAAQNLERAGAEAIVLCANTAHAVADEIVPQLAVPLIHIVDATAVAIKAQGLSKVALLGTIFTMEMDFYLKGLSAHGIEAVIPPASSVRNHIQEVIRDELGRGLIRPESKAAFVEIINDLVDNGAQGVILGCTEIPLLVSQSDVTIPVFDTTKIHADAAVAFALNGTVKPSLRAEL